MPPDPSSRTKRLLRWDKGLLICQFSSAIHALSRPFGDSEAISLVSLGCPISFPCYSPIGSSGTRTHRAHAAHHTLYSVRRKSSFSLTSLPSSVFTFLRRCRSNDNSPHVTRVRPSFPRLVYPAPSWTQRRVRAQCEVNEAGAMGIEAKGEQEVHAYVQCGAQRGATGVTLVLSLVWMPGKG